MNITLKVVLLIVLLIVFEKPGYYLRCCVIVFELNTFLIKIKKKVISSKLVGIDSKCSSFGNNIIFQIQIILLELLIPPALTLEVIMINVLWTIITKPICCNSNVIHVSTCEIAST